MEAATPWKDEAVGMTESEFTMPQGISVINAGLPKVYESAKAALAECSRIDECKDWANKAEAIASHARQAEDDPLRKTADRIQARAISIPAVI